MSVPRRRLAVGAVGLLLSAGCGSSSPNAAPRSSGTPRTPVAPSGTAVPAPSGSDGSGAAPSGTASLGTPIRPGSSATSGQPSGSATPLASPAMPSVDTWVDKDCVAQGGTMTVSAHSEPKRGLAYTAIYAGEKGGGPPPYGYGYGGNDKGFTDADGDYSSTWTVAINAPLGKARVELYVGATDGFRKGVAHFRVVSSPFGC